MEEEIIALAHCPFLTQRRFFIGVKHFGSAKALYHASPAELQALAWQEKTKHKFIAWRRGFNLEKALQVLETEGIRVINQNSPEYPPLLKEMFDPPLCLFVRGNLNTHALHLAMVGSRKASTYGRYICETLIPSLAQQGLCIVSGLAIGIDSAVHQACLDAGGKTIAILGGGINNSSIAPRMNLSLAQSILEHDGAIISEYAPGFTPNKYTFPMRNRIIAGMSLGTVVIEAGIKSGSLITAQSAFDNNREVFTLPHPITSLQGRGCNQLLQQGAHLVQTAEDIIEVLDLPQKKQFQVNKQILPTNEKEAQILTLLSEESLHIDILIRRSPYPASDVGSVLTMMEMKGMVKQVRPREYVRACPA